jgi:thiol:disulfide interchange protein
MTKSIVIALTLLVHTLAHSQDQSLLTYEISDPGQVKVGDTITFQVNLNLQPGWYIYAPTALNRTQDVQVMKLKFQALPALLSACTELNMPLTRVNKSHEVFEGEVNEFSQRFVVNTDVQPGEYIMTAQLKYQACSNSICYPPVTEKINIPFTVLSGGLPTSQIVDRAIARAKKENKKAFIMFHSSWCVWCRKMDTAMQNVACRKKFEANYVIEHLTVYESDGNKKQENPGADELLKKHQPPKSGIPFWLIFDGDGQLIADSQIRPPGASLQTKGRNMGCPTAPDEVAYFINILRKTSSMNEEDLLIITSVFSKIK